VQAEVNSKDLLLITQKPPLHAEEITTMVFLIRSVEAVNILLLAGGDFCGYPPSPSFEIINKSSIFDRGSIG